MTHLYQFNPSESYPIHSNNHYPVNNQTWTEVTPTPITNHWDNEIPSHLSDPDPPPPPPSYRDGPESASCSFSNCTGFAPVNVPITTTEVVNNSWRNHCPDHVVQEVHTYYPHTMMNIEPVPPVLVPIRPLVPVTVWENLLVNFRKGNFRTLLSLLRRAGPILKDYIIPVLRAHKELHQNRPTVISRPVTILA